LWAPIYAKCDISQWSKFAKGGYWGGEEMRSANSVSQSLTVASRRRVARTYLVGIWRV
jgi:hypothetical protein